MSGVWASLRSAIDPSLSRPRLCPGVEVKLFHRRSEVDYGVVAGPREILHYRLDPQEAETLELMDGTRTVKEIVVEGLGGSGGLELGRIAQLVRDLERGNFLERPFIDVHRALGRALRRKAGAMGWLRLVLGARSVEWKGAHAPVKWLYDRFIKWLFTRPALLLSAAVGVAGVLAFAATVRAGELTLTTRSVVWEALVLIGMNFLATAAHELGHASVLVRHGRRVGGAGFVIISPHPRSSSTHPTS